MDYQTLRALGIQRYPVSARDLEDEGDLQPSSPWQVKEKDYISTTIIEAIRKASKSEGPRVTKVETFNKDVKGNMNLLASGG